MEKSITLKNVILALFLILTSAWAVNGDVDYEKAVPCIEGTTRMKYSGPRYPQNTQWKIPLQIASGYFVGALAAGYAVNGAFATSSKNEGCCNSGSHDLIFGFVAALTIGLPVFTLANPIPIYIIGNIGNEKSSIGFTFLGSFGGLIVPFIGGPIGATILNRSKRTYKYYCLEEPTKIGMRIHLFEPKINIKDDYETKYQLDLVKIEM
jgi:hypothetical protein